MTSELAAAKRSMESTSASPITEEKCNRAPQAKKDSEPESKVCGGAHLEFNWEEALHAISTLSLTFANLGNYVIILNEDIDVIIHGEPYTAIQLWFEKKSCKFLGRVWNETIATGKVKNIAQFIDVCVSHLKRRPCIGYPAHDLYQKGQEFVICPTTIPRKMSRACQKVLESTISTTIKSCPACLLRIQDDSTVPATINTGLKVEPKLCNSEGVLYVKS